MRFSIVAIAILLLSAGCGSSPKRESVQAPDQPEKRQQVDSSESGIPGLSVAEVEAQPVAPELPARFGADTTTQELQALAESQARNDARRRLLGELSEAKRAIYLVHVWSKEVDRRRRAMPSHIPGLTIGDLEDQPPVPPLPALYDLRHKADPDAFLERHAVIVAREEAAAGTLGGLSLDQRRLYLVWAWSPQLDQRLDQYQQAVDRQQAHFEHERRSAAVQSSWRQRESEAERQHRRRMEIESRVSNPVLSPDEAGQLVDRRQ